MEPRIYLLFFLIIVSCYGAKLKQSQDDVEDPTTSPTISIQKFNGKTFFNYIKHSERISSNSKRKQAVSSGRDEENENVSFSEDDEDDAESVPTTENVIVEIVDVEVEKEESKEANTEIPPGNLHEDAPSASDSSGKPAEEDGAHFPEAPGDSSDPNPGDAVPGQPEDPPANASGESSESSEDEDDYSSSSSSSSEERERVNEEEKIKTNWEKAWRHKLQNELINRTGKSKDALKAQLPLLTKLAKKEVKFSRRIS